MILVDADYADKVAFDLIVNFERMIGRRIPKADMARWLECVALDGGLREGQHETQVVLIHGKGKTRMENFTPGEYASELDGKAFYGNLGEFTVSSLPVEEDMVTAADLFTDALGVICNSKDVKRLMVIPDAETIYDKVRSTLRRFDCGEKTVTVFAGRQFPSGDTRLLAHAGTRHKGRRDKMKYGTSQDRKQTLITKKR